MTRQARPVIDILIVVVVSVLVFLTEDQLSMRGWIPVPEYARGATTVVAGALAAVGVVLARGGTLADLGFKRPNSWGRVFVQSLLVLAAFIVAQLLSPVLVSLVIAMPEPDLSRYDAISGSVAAAVALALVLPLTASIPEEVIYRGFLIGRLSELFGHGPVGTLTSIFVQALAFGSVHFQWGPGGMLVTFVMGLVWGVAYLWCDRNLWVVILAHSAGHVLGVVQLYLQTTLVV